MKIGIFLLCITLIHAAVVQSRLRHHKESFLKRKGNRLIDRYEQTAPNSNALFSAKKFDFNEFYRGQQDDNDDQYDYEEYYDAQYNHADDDTFFDASSLLNAYDAEELYHQLSLGIATLQNYYDYNEWANNLQRYQRMGMDEQRNKYYYESAMDRLSALGDYYNMYRYMYADPEPDNGGMDTKESGSDNGDGGNDDAGTVDSGTGETGTEDGGSTGGEGEGDDPKQDPITEGTEQAYKEEKVKMVAKAKASTKLLIQKQETKELADENKQQKRHQDKNEQADSGTGSDPNPSKEDEEGDMEKAPPDTEDL